MEILFDAKRTVELMRGGSVRVLIPENTDVEIAVRQIGKIAAWLKCKPELMKKAEWNFHYFDDPYDPPF